EHFLNLFKTNPLALAKNENNLNTKKRALKISLENFIKEFNSKMQDIEDDNATKLVEIFAEYENILDIKFSRIDRKAIPKVQDDVKNEEKEIVVSINQSQSSTISNKFDILTANEREHRDFFLNLAYDILQQDLANTSAYAIFTQAMWGRITNTPPHTDFITQIRYPDANLINNFNNPSQSGIDAIKFYMSNLALNPYYFEGIVSFCNFLQKLSLHEAVSILIFQTRSFLSKNEILTSLKYQNSHYFCDDKCFKFFNNTQNEIKEETMQIATLEGTFLNMEQNLKQHNAKQNLNAMLDMVKIFEQNNMKNNAKMIYAQIINFIENTELKEYLSEIYQKAKVELR
ncbi:MAG: type VI secretion system domain-containing protein, partial [Campylobacter sp.]|nr:type VI secretion system domain-containing protein [Campylobacter sp.]